MKKLIVGCLFLISGCAGILPAPTPTDPCSACSLYTNPETVKVCQDAFCLVARPTAIVTSTAAPTATAQPTISKPTNTPVPKGQISPAISFVNGCDASNPNSVDPNTGRCEFNIWEKLTINDMVNFAPACGDNCPMSFLHPQGMGLACDHMYADQGVSAAIYEPKIGKYVTIMYYICSGRLWDYVKDFNVHAVYPSHDCVGSDTNCVKWESRIFRNDPYNGRISGHGNYVICVPNDAYTCKDPKDLEDQNVYVTGICPSGNIPLDGAGACAGPYTVNR